MIKEIFSSPENENFMFGYFDKSQISPCGNYYACQRITKLDKYYKRDEYVDIGYFKKNENHFYKLDKSSAFNFQQGCMINWINYEGENSLIYNFFNNNLLNSKIYIVNLKKYYIVDFPIYAVSKNSNFFLTINFYNLFKFKRGYSYDFDLNYTSNFHTPDELAIWMYDFKTKKLNKILSSNDLNIESKNHWIEHISISPDNFNFVFLLRKKMNDGGIQTTFYLSDINKTKLVKINNSGRASHFNWFSKENIIVYGGIENYTNKLRKSKFIQSLPFIKILIKIYHKFISHNSTISKKITGDCYYILDINSLNHKRIESIKLNLEDGHPSIDTKFNKYLLTDLYSDLPNKKPKIIIFDLNLNEIIYEKEFESIQKLDNSPYRCDLHPRFLDGQLLFSIDCFIKNKRGFKVFELTHEYLS